MKQNHEYLNKRSAEVFKEIVDSYIETGGAIGSKSLSERISTKLSPATIRNVMSDLESLGFLYSPHTSSGRIPTDQGLKFFTHALLEVGDIENTDREFIENLAKEKGLSTNDLVEKATKMLSGLSKCASLVVSPKSDMPLKEIKFVQLSENRVLVILISIQGVVENRILDLPESVPINILERASNYLSNKLAGRTLKSASEEIIKELSNHKKDLDKLTAKIVEEGLAAWSSDGDYGSLIIKGQSNLLNSFVGDGNLDKIHDLFSILDEKENFSKLIDASINADGVQVFIGSENQLFSMAGCSMVVSTYKDAKKNVLGTIGVIGHSRMNYRRVIPLVDYTAKIISKITR